jgi:DNA repair exonuclease SbcCD ATPase subunit
LLAEWKAGRPVVRIADTELDTRITDAIKTQMQRVAEQAASAAEERAAAAADDLQAISEAQADAEQKIAVLTAERDTAKAQAADFVAQLAETHADMDRAAEQAATAAAELRKELTTERAKQETTAAALARVEVRLEAVPKLEEQIATMRVALANVEAQRQEAVTAAAVAVAKIEANDKTLAQAMMHLESAKRDIEGMRIAALALGAEGNVSREKTAALYERLEALMIEKKPPVATPDVVIEKPARVKK